MDSLTQQTHAALQNYYGKVLKSSSDLKTSACCTVELAPQHLLPLFQNVPEEIRAKYYGCGFPVPTALTNRAVLDLGCGTGRDVYLAAQMIGPQGRVVGVDMTDEQLAIAEKHKAQFCQTHQLKESQISFVKGFIEQLDQAGIEDESFDIAISNCVVNLATNKKKVLASLYRTLKEEGEFYLSDVFVDRRLPKPIAEHELLYSECLGGALYQHDFKYMAQEVGFKDIRTMTQKAIEIHDPQLRKLIGEARFTSVTYRLFKIASLDYQCEDYGQSATYKGGIEGHPTLFWFDEHHAFEKGRPERVCGNTFAMLKARYADFFDLTGDRSTHFGFFRDCDTVAAQEYKSQRRNKQQAAPNSNTASCC